MDMDEIEELKKKISELESEVRDLRQDLIHDRLTSLKTRRFFEEKTDTHISLFIKVKEDKRRKRLGIEDFSLIFFDIDHFKKINDTYGHSMGDEVLKMVGKTISSKIRIGDVATRWGGEEIAVFLLGSKEKDAKDKAEDIRECVSKLEFPEHPDLKVTVSAGVVGFEGGFSSEEVLKKADDALYKAKEAGRNKVVAYSEISE